MNTDQVTKTTLELAQRQLATYKQLARASEFVPSSDNPSFCFITPIDYLAQFASKSRTHLVLAHLVDQDPSQRYGDFYRKRRNEGDYVMMDNSAYELKEPYSPDKLLTLSQQCGAHAIVLPDYPFQPANVTVKAAQQFAPIFREAGLQNFFVPQSERGDLEDWINAYVWAAQNPDIDIIGMSILGIPNALPHIPPSYARVVMTQLLIDRGVFDFNKHHHYLGLNSGPALEIPALVKMKALTTIDSSGPVWTAILGHEYSINTDSYLSVSKPTTPVDFHLPLTKNKETLERINHNVDMTLGLFNNNSEEKVWYAQE